jgi:hypothetical protein
MNLKQIKTILKKLVSTLNPEDYIDTVSSIMNTDLEDAEITAYAIIEEYNALPNPFPVYRGINLNSPSELNSDYGKSPEEGQGHSWTTEKSVAERFGNYILCGLVNKKDVDWDMTVHNRIYFLLEDEFEIVIHDQNKVKLLKIEDSNGRNVTKLFKL